eukprot:scaffold28171_cov19-Tisochrysis_lutea.AAC.2
MPFRCKAQNRRAWQHQSSRSGRSTPKAQARQKQTWSTRLSLKKKESRPGGSLKKRGRLGGSESQKEGRSGGSES